MRPSVVILCEAGKGPTAGPSISTRSDFSQRLGGVYCVEVPSYDGRIRVKIGWADSFDDRLSTYRTIVPDLRILGLWPTRDQWMERAALKLAENIGARVFTELFEFEDNAAATSRLNELFFASFGVRSVLEDTDMSDTDLGGN